MTAKVNPAEVLKLVERGSKQACLDFFAKLSVAERRPLAKPMLKKYKQADAAWLAGVSRENSKLFGNSAADELENAKIGVFATATLSELLKLGWRAVPGDGFIVNLVRTLTPDWTNAWASELIESQPRVFNDIRLLYEAGLCEKPVGEGYTLGLLEALPGWLVAPPGLWANDLTLADRIRSTPDIRDVDVWRLFEVEGGGDLSLAAFDKYIGGSKIGGWTDALAELAADGTLSRDRLLDASLEALQRDFAQFRAGWFSRFHEHLQPTLDERVQRLDHYLQLLGSSIPPTVSFALKAIALIDKANELPPERLLAHAQPVLQARAKGTVAAGLRLLGKAAQRAPELAGRVACVAAAALIHETADVQKKTLDLIEGLDGGELGDVVAAMQNYADGIAPSVQGQFMALAGPLDSSVAPEQSQAAAAINVSAAVTLIADVIPIGSFDEFNREFLRVIENPSCALDVERVLDGLARHGADKPNNFGKLVGPLGKRAKAIVQRRTDDQLQYQLAKLAVAYAKGENIVTDSEIHYPNVDIGRHSFGKDRESRSFEEVFLWRNIQLLAQLGSGHALPLLSAPSDQRGFVAVDELLARYNKYKARSVVPGEIDMVLALLRLSPDGRENALSLLAQDTEFDQAVGYAVGEDVTIGTTSWLWVAAAAARLPYQDQPAIAKLHGLGNPDAGTKARYTIEFDLDQYFTWLRIAVEPKIDRSLPELYLSSLFHTTTAGATHNGSICGHHVNMIRWCSSIWPLNPEPFFAQGLLVFDHSQRLANTPYAAFIEPMLDAHVKIGAMGSWMLALGLASSDPAIKSLALDAAIAAIEEHRLDAELLRQALAALIPSGHVPVGRWTKSLSELGAVSNSHMQFVRDLIAGSLRHDPAEAPRDIGGLVELLYEYSTATGAPIADPQALEYLKAVNSGGKLKRFAGKLLAQT